jgi:hypothetical protein
MSEHLKKAATKRPHVLERIVVVEQGSCTEHVSQLAGPNQKVLVQAPGESLQEFVLRTSLRKSTQLRAKTALVLLGDSLSLGPRKQLLGELAELLVPGNAAEIRLMSADAAERKWVAWQLLEEAHNNEALRTVRLGFKVSDHAYSIVQKSA